MQQTKYGIGNTLSTFLNKLLLDFCSSGSDCESFHLKTTCKESIPGGSRTCLGPIDCTRDCLPGHYCDSQNRCKARRTEKGKVSHSDFYLFNLDCISATCISNSDCSNKRPRTVCTESSTTGEKTCNKPSKKACKEGCADGEFCSGDRVCKNGMFCDHKYNIHKFDIHLHN
jgi:hypothetical protein